ncbi:MAG: hypothetical protein K0S09_1459 [Sphingobacteriaceae bacterium]|jgi:hypothetical protein|nr:hypothetical protein [Sphingobacteriaceae bacterium]
MLQKITLNGKGLLPGVSVRVKGTTAGPIIDANGHFSVTVAHSIIQ